jgi:hypothetical protein
MSVGEKTVTKVLILKCEVWSCLPTGVGLKNITDTDVIISIQYTCMWNCKLGKPSHEIHGSD